MPRKYRRRANREWLHPVVHLLGILAVWVYEFLRWLGKKLGLEMGIPKQKKMGNEIDAKALSLLALVE